MVGRSAGAVTLLFGCALALFMGSVAADCPHPGYVSDGGCDPSNNIADCGFDGGDCSPCDCVDTDDYPCGSYGDGFDCVNPNSACVGGECANNSHCDTDAGEICCPVKLVCEVPVSVGACGDPHMTGFRGQKFDFTGQDGAWYSVVDDGPLLQINMRVTSPVPDLPEVTYITGVSIITTSGKGANHAMVIQVTDPHRMDTTCPAAVAPCLAEGALSVEIDGEEALLAPGTVWLSPDVAISAVNLPGACRSFGFEQYWQLKQQDQAQNGRKLGRLANRLQEMARWILDDPTATNMAECAEYVAAAGESGLFSHDSEHASFQILTPLGTVRLSHGRLHQLAMRDPTDQFDLPDHLAWQMNLAIEHDNISLNAKGILGETLVPTVDEFGEPIMRGMGAIRGKQENYRVDGPL